MCMVMKLHRKEHLEFGLNAFETVILTSETKKGPGQSKKLKNVELQQLHPNKTVIADCQ